MKFSTELILEILKDQIISSKIKEFEDYIWIDIVHVDGGDKNPGKKLIFATYGEENEWHFAFDRREKVELYSKNNHVIVDFATQIENTIQVKSLETSAKLLYDYVYLKNNFHTTVIGVTGSVGKTTTVGMIEYVLKKCNKNVVRFYSKRIFPLSLFCHYINKVETKTEYIVMEYSLFYASHVNILAQLLPPTYAFILNILNMHMEERLGFLSKEDIFNSKANIFVSNKTKKLFLHSDLKKYKIKPYIESEYYPSAEFNYIHSMPPTTRTLQMLGAMEKFFEIINNEPNQTVGDNITLINDYIPVENRIILVQTNQGEIYFHGETSTAERLKSFLESDLTCNLFIDEINFSQGDPNYYTDELKYIFERDFTFVLDTELNREKIKYFVSNVQFLKKNEFVKKLKEVTGYIVYHKSLFVRQKEISIEQYLKEILK